MKTAVAILLGIVAGALYTLSPLLAWCTALAAIVLSLAGRGLPSPERRALNIVLVAALVARLAAVGALFVINIPMHDDESVAMLSGDEAYGVSRALRTRDIITGAPLFSRVVVVGVCMGADKLRPSMAINKEIDVRHVLPAVRVPTLILHGSEDTIVPREVAVYLAAQIPTARVTEIPGAGHLAFGAPALAAATEE